MQFPHTEQIEYRIKRKDGTILRVLDKMRSVRHTDGTMWGYSIVLELDDKEPISYAPASASPVQPTFGQNQRPKVEIHTFGYFEVAIDGVPIAFKSAKAKELLALLVDRRGNYVARESIIAALWENEPLNPTTVTRCRKTYKNLVDELKSYGIEWIVSTENNMRRLVRENVSCDLFEYLEGRENARDAFRGAYLTEYSWSEVTLSTLLQSLEG